MPAKDKWWDDVISTDSAPYYATSEKAQEDNGALNRSGRPKAPPGGRKGSFIWGDRVRILRSEGSAKEVSGRGVEYWVNERHLGGEPLLEVYVIDVGQGDGLLVVTPEGHNLMVDGGNIRRNQNGGKNAADFVDWKFFKDYTSEDDRGDPNEVEIQLDAMIASHNDIDHFGGLWDLIQKDERNLAELDCSGVTVEAVYHAGLSWWWNGRTESGQNKRSLGPTDGGHYTKLLGNRTSAKAATENLDSPDFDTLSGSWGKFIHAATKLKRSNGSPSAIVRLSNETHDFLPGFGPNGPDSCSIRLLGPIEASVAGTPGLRKFPNGNSKNTNGHSIVLRLDYRDRRILLTGDLNTHSQNHIMSHFGLAFVEEYQCDVAKGCHHGSHDVSYRFLDGLRPLATVISSGDAETHDHPRPTIVAASAITGRRLVDLDEDRLVAPLIYVTEIARSVDIARIRKMGEYREQRPSFERERPTGAEMMHDKEEEMSRFRLFLGSSQSSPYHWPRLDDAKTVRNLRYGLINVRTDGHRLFFAQMEESGGDWAISTLSEKQISEAR